MAGVIGYVLGVDAESDVGHLAQAFHKVVEVIPVRLVHCPIQGRFRLQHFVLQITLNNRVEEVILRRAVRLALHRQPHPLHRRNEILLPTRPPPQPLRPLPIARRERTSLIQHPTHLVHEMRRLSLPEREFDAPDQIALVHGEFGQFLDVIPSVLLVFVGLHPFDPLEQCHDPSHFHRAFVVGARRLGICAEVDVSVFTLSTLVCGPLPQVVIQLAEVAHALGVEGTASPPAASLDVGPTQVGGPYVPLFIHHHTSFNLVEEHGIVVSRRGLLGSAREALQRRGRIALEGTAGLGGHCHVWVDVASVLFFDGADAFVVGWGGGVGDSVLTAGVAEGVETVEPVGAGSGKDHFPVEFVASIIQNNHRHTLSQKRRHVRQSNMPSVSIAIVRSHVKRQPLAPSPIASRLSPLDARARHPFEGGTKVGVFVLGGGFRYILVVVGVGSKDRVFEEGSVGIEVV
mmetsp:Transcript_26203/g.56492  ORF Transcript_26203/g.56492 Transcript_26203/m.56492 type:complete len:459 (-) Transcript_26203:477-1853(-)